MPTVDEYFANVPARARELLRAMRETIRKAAPQAEELISYKMPAFKLDGILVYYAAHKDHIGFYPTASGISAFKKELAGYKTARGSVQFPMDRPLPLDVVDKIVRFRVNENVERAKRRHIL